MANPEHLEILKQGVDVWNQWRVENSNTKPDLLEANLSYADLNLAYLGEADLSLANLSGADLFKANLSEAYLGGANLSEANLSYADLSLANLGEANLSGADLSGADLFKADLSGTDLSGTDLSEANLGEANLSGAVLRGAVLRGADLRGANLVGTNFADATLIGCHVFGISAWKLNLKGATQTDLVISDYYEPIVTVDNLEVAQFIYLLLNNERIRNIIDTITTKIVLILGRFTPERKAVLDAIREELRRQNYIPVLFDFDKPASRDLTETISTLAHLARFVIADITDPRSIPQELQAIVPDLAVPVQAVIQADQEPWGMFQDFPHKYHWVLAVHRYRDLDDLLASLRDKVIGPAEAKAKELQGR